MDSYKKRLKKYVENSMKLGASMDTIRENVLDSGCPKKVFDSIVKDIGPTSKLKPDIYDFIRKNQYLIKMGILGLIAVILLAGIIYIMFLVDENEIDCGEDRLCFLENALDCTNAVFQKDFNGTIVEYRVNNNCVLTKKIIGLDESEPDEVKALFLNKEMNCTYEEGYFDEWFIEEITGNIDQCEGELKDNIYDLLITIYGEE